MRRRIFVSDFAGNRFVRITYREAFQRWIKGEPVELCPVKMRPGLPFSPSVQAPNISQFREGMFEYRAIPYAPEYWDKRAWNTLITQFNYYNGSHESGYYPAFYIMERISLHRSISPWILKPKEETAHE